MGASDTPRDLREGTVGQQDPRASAFDVSPGFALISFPQVLGHEVVGTLAHVGPESGRRPGERVVLNPWLSCVTRGLDPCEWCRRGDLAQCRNFTQGRLAPGIEHRNFSGVFVGSEK